MNGVPNTFNYEICFYCKLKFMPNRLTKKCVPCNVYFCSSCAPKMVDSYYTVAPTRNQVCTKCSQYLSCVENAPFLKNDEFWRFRDSQQEIRITDAESRLGDILNTHFKAIEILSGKNGELQDQTAKLIERNKEIQEEAKLMETFLTMENKLLKDELENMRNEMKVVKALFVNIEDPKDDVPDENLMDKIKVENDENVEFKNKFDEFEEYIQVIKDIELDQEKITMECVEIEKKSSGVCADLEKKVEDIQSKIESFVIEAKNDLQDKKSQLLREMKLKIDSLKEQQNASKEHIRKLQEQNIKRSKVLQNKLDLVESQFHGTVQLKDDMINYFEDPKAPKVNKLIATLNNAKK